MDASNSCLSSELKRSCEECSSSKVKCSQDKPTCKRCRKQRTACIYAPAKRIGRPRKIRKDESSQPPTVRLLASAASRQGDVDPPPPQSTSPLSDYSIDQAVLSHGQGGLAPITCFGLDGAAHFATECHFIDHGWSTTAQDMDTIWDTALDSCFDSSDAELGSYGFQGGNCGVVSSVWKQQKTRRTADSQNFYKSKDLQMKEAESALWLIYNEDVQFGTL
ncbi:Fungal transcriptional regulatory protein [Cordyceps militaris CM01]|uniref:Fungal transcriptional regulatory protein n=1 Tax=Cordyceps militaris (strain CM01) TaxID=983644 RepID=G3JES7_CORMM|nr:Fungal transcriptional regulatory protein [Cordyceps militaris CM01]EGX93036.1 Fungal transcriptional regulatory protein [Cordyceps militaris CM01]